MRSPKEHNLRRVVVTGLGVVSSIGIGWQDFWKNLLAGKNGISEADFIDLSKYDRKYAGQVKNFKPEKFIPKSRLKYVGRASQMAVAASQMALQDAGLTKKDIDSFRAGVCIGTTTGEIGLLEQYTSDQVKGKSLNQEIPRLPFYPASSLSANIAKWFSFKGENKVFANACSSANYAVAQSYDAIQRGEADGMLAGGVDGFSRLVFSGFARLIAIAPEKCQPFDKNRQGMIPAEGSGILFLEDYEHAVKRKARIYAELLGYGISSDACHMTQPSAIGIGKSIQKALRNAKVDVDQINYISAHGTGTSENDKAECAALRKVFGNLLDNIPVSSIKSMLGHTMGAASALESIACCLAIIHGKIPPTINYETSDPECDIDCVPNEFRAHEVNVVLNNASAFGGNNAAVVFKRFTA